MMDTNCTMKDCKNAETTRLDFTCTGIGDFRWYCFEHLHIGERALKLQSLRHDVGYLKSTVISEAKKMTNAVTELQQKQEELTKLSDMNADQYKAMIATQGESND